MKKFLKIAALLIIYFLLMYLPMFPGFLSPILWFFYPVLSALIAATPLMWGVKNKNKIGSVAVFPLFWYLLMVLMGELSFPESLISPLIIIAASEIIRKLVGYEKRLALRLSYAVTSLVAVMQHLIILTRADFYYQGAVEEMGSTEYSETIMSLGTPGYFALLIVLTFAAGYVGAIISEKLFKDKVMVTAAKKSL